MIFKFGKIEICRTFLVGVPIYTAVPIHPIYITDLPARFTVDYVYTANYCRQ